MFISKTRFINWTRCPMYFPMELKHNPSGKDDIDEERERREEMLEELKSEMASSGSSEDTDDDEEAFDAKPGPELEALLPYYNQVEEEALKAARKCFKGDFVADSKDVHKQKLFEYEQHGHTYRCYVDIYNENDDAINIIEVKATTSSKFIYRIDEDGTKKGLYFSDVAPRQRNGNTYSLFIKDGNIWRLNVSDREINNESRENFDRKKQVLLDRYRDEGKYPHDIAFQRFVIEHALRKAGESRPINYYLAVLNCEYVYDGAVDAKGSRVYNAIDGQEIVTFFDMNEISKEYQPFIITEVATVESYIKSPHNIESKTPVGKWCAWGTRTECLFCNHCFEKLRDVPVKNKANNYLNFRGFRAGDISDKYQLINEGYFKFDDVPVGWLSNENHLIQRNCYDHDEEFIDKDKMQYWLEQIQYPIYHFDFESFACPLPRFSGENPYRQSVFEFSLHIEREAGVCDKQKDNFIFLNEEFNDDERKALAKAIVDHFEFNEDGSLLGTMLAQNMSFEKQRLEELATLYPEYKDKLLAIRDKAMDLIHLLKTNRELYVKPFGRDRAATINYYNKDLSGSYSIKKTLPVLVPDLTYEGMDVGNGVQAYIAYLNYDSVEPTFGKLKTKEERRDALELYCQQDTWAMVEILRAVRSRLKL